MISKKEVIETLELFKDEKWVQLYEFTNYQISNFGRIKAIGREMSIGIRYGKECFRYKEERILSQRTNGVEQFLFTDISYKDEKGKKFGKTVYIHKAVCDHFVDKPKHIKEYENNGGHICASHIVKDYTNNRFDNVKWITSTELIQNQPNRLANPTKAWETRRKLYGYSGEKPKEKVELYNSEVVDDYLELI